MDWIVNEIRLAWNLICVIKIQRTYNWMEIFSKNVVMLIGLVKVVALGYD